jgi:hypothetical protein
MALTVETPVLTEPYDVPDRQALAWVDAMLHDVEVDILHREVLARASNQGTISLTLAAQAALLVRLRSRIHSRYWSLRNGTAAQVE